MIRARATGKQKDRRAQIDPISLFQTERRTAPRHSPSRDVELRISVRLRCRAVNILRLTRANSSAPSFADWQTLQAKRECPFLRRDVPHKEASPAIPRFYSQSVDHKYPPAHAARL